MKKHRAKTLQEIEALLERLSDDEDRWFSHFLRVVTHLKKTRKLWKAWAKRLEVMQQAERDKRRERRRHTPGEGENHVRGSN